MERRTRADHRLKRKMGNVSNASSETGTARRARGMVGPSGGVATIIEMVAMTRFDCMIGLSAGMRMAVSGHRHCRQRKASRS
jgi:putative acyl-CoA dehydrogenase